MKKKLIAAGIIILVIAVAVLIFILNMGSVQNKIDNVKGDLVGRSFHIEGYDGYGQQTLTLDGRSVSMAGNKNGSSEDASADESSVITVTIDGDEMESCGDTLIFADKDLKKEVNFSAELASNSHGVSSIAYKINKYANKFGKDRIVVIKSQLGQPLMAYSGNKVYWEVVEDLPKTTKLMIDGQPLYIHRANFQIIDSDLID